MRTLRSLVAMWLIICWTSSSLWLALVSAKIGKKACEKAPSANKRLKKFGILNATKNASVNSLAPKSLPITKSLIRPNIRDTKVIAETMLLDLINDLDMIYGY